MISVSRFTDAQLETNPRRSLHHAPCADRDALASWLVFLGIRKSCGRRTCTKAPVSSGQLPGTATGRKEVFRNQLAQSHCARRLVGRTEKRPPLVPLQSGGRGERGRQTDASPGPTRWSWPKPTHSAVQPQPKPLSCSVRPQRGRGQQPQGQQMPCLRLPVLELGTKLKNHKADEKKGSRANVSSQPVNMDDPICSKQRGPWKNSHASDDPTGRPHSGVNRRLRTGL